MKPTSSSITLSGSLKRGIWLHMKPPARFSPSNTVTA